MICRLEAEWSEIAGSWWLRRHLRIWGVEDPRLAFEDGYQLLDAAQTREASSWAERDQVLTAVLERFVDDPITRRVALQIVLPQIKSLINGLRGWEVEERAARVIAEAVEVLAYCATGPAGTPPSFDDLEWVRQRGKLREDVARIVVLTRAARVSVGELAESVSMTPAIHPTVFPDLVDASTTP